MQISYAEQGVLRMYTTEIMIAIAMTQMHNACRPGPMCMLHIGLLASTPCVLQDMYRSEVGE